MPPLSDKRVWKRVMRNFFIVLAATAVFSVVVRGQGDARAELEGQLPEPSDLPPDESHQLSRPAAACGTDGSERSHVEYRVAVIHAAGRGERLLQYV